MKWDEHESGAAGSSHDTKTELLSLHDLLAARERARKAMERDAEEQLSKTLITTSDILATAPGQDLVVIDITMTTAITTIRDDLFNGPWALDIHRQQPYGGKVKEEK